MTWPAGTAWAPPRTIANMTRDIEHARGADADKITASWRFATTIFDASLGAGEGVQRTSARGSSRGEMTGYDRPLQAVFRWGPDVTEPCAILSWRESPDGEIERQEIALGR